MFLRELLAASFAATASAIAPLNVLHNVDNAILGVKVTRAYNVHCGGLLSNAQFKNRFLEGRDDHDEEDGARLSRRRHAFGRVNKPAPRRPRRTGGSRRRDAAPAHQIRKSASGRSRADRADHFAHHAASADALSGRHGAARRASERSRLRQSDIHRQFRYSPRITGLASSRRRARNIRPGFASPTPRPFSRQISAKMVPTAAAWRSSSSASREKRC